MLTPKTPPLLSIGGQTFTLDQIKKVVRAGTTETTTPTPTPTTTGKTK